MKERLLSAPVLMFPKMSHPFILTCDATKQGLGFRLTQKDDKDNK